MPTARGIQRAANAEQNHPKVQLRVLPTKSTFLAGTELTGVVQLECTSDKLYLGDIWLELLGSEGVFNR